MIILKSKTICLRLANEADAPFILKLRSDERYNRFLSAVPSDIDKQISWIRNYKIEEAAGRQFYFIIEKHDGTPCGTVRIYDIRQESFCWGSWILNEDKTRYAAMESAFLVYQFGFDILGFKKSHFDVMKGNEKVISFHTKIGAYKIDEDEENVYFEISKESVAEAKEKLISKLGL